MKYVILSIFALANLAMDAQVTNRKPKAVITPANIDSVIAFEKIFAENDSTPAPENSSWFEFRPGTRKILIVAAHATAHIRDHEIKQADAGTGSVAIELNKLLHVPVLYTTYLSPADPNFYDDNEFKDSLAKIIKRLKPIIVLDLHGSHPFRPYDIDFGTMNGKSYLKRRDLLDSLKNAFSNEGLINQSEDYFPAAKNQTITKFVSKKGVPCIQLEINTNYTSPGTGDIYAQKTAQLLQVLYRFIKGIPNSIPQGARAETNFNEGG